jgi:hypothetical protein
VTPVLALLFSLSQPGALDPPPLLLHGGPAAPRAWLAAVQSTLWVCWDDGARLGEPDPGCWQRVDVPPHAPDPRELRVGFLDPGTVAMRAADDAVFLLVRGDPTPHPSESAAAIEPGERLAAIACSPSGHVPIYRRGGWAWAPSPCALPAGQCVATPALPRLRRPANVELFVRLELRTATRLRVTEASRTTVRTSVIASVGVAFDPRRWLGRQVAWHELQAARRPRLRKLPATRSQGALAVREREALAAILCGGHVQ